MEDRHAELLRRLDQYAKHDPQCEALCDRCGLDRSNGCHSEGWTPGSGAYWHEFEARGSRCTCGWVDARAAIAQMAQELTDLRDRDRIISRQLDQRAGGRDAFTQALIQKSEDMQTRAERADAQLREAEAARAALVEQWKKRALGRVNDHLCESKYVPCHVCARASAEGLCAADLEATLRR